MMSKFDQAKPTRKASASPEHARLQGLSQDVDLSIDTSEEVIDPLLRRQLSPSPSIGYLDHFPTSASGSSSFQSRSAQASAEHLLGVIPSLELPDNFAALPGQLPNVDQYGRVWAATPASAAGSTSTEAPVAIGKSRSSSPARPDSGAGLPSMQRRKTKSGDQLSDPQREEFLERNRNSAKRSRQRKKQYEAELQQHVEHLTQSNARLTATVSELREEVSQLRETMRQHEEHGCYIAQPGQGPTVEPPQQHQPWHDTGQAQYDTGQGHWTMLPHLHDLPVQTPPGLYRLH